MKNPGKSMNNWIVCMCGKSIEYFGQAVFAQQHSLLRVVHGRTAKFFFYGYGMMFMITGLSRRCEELSVNGGLCIVCKSISEA